MILKWVLPALMLSTSAAVAQEASLGTFHVIDSIPGPDGFHDYISVDGEQRRVFVGRSTGVMVIDLPARTVLGSLVSGDSVASVLPIPFTSLMVSTSPEKGQSIIFDRRNGTVLSHVATGQDPDGAAYDLVSRRVFVMNGESGDISVIDPIAGKNVGTIPLGGKPEAAISDGHGRVFVNIEDKSEIIVVDTNRLSVIDSYPLSACNEPTGIAYDSITQLLVSVCHNGIAKLVDARDGKERGAFPIGQGADGVIFDPVRRLLFVPCDDGTLTIASLDDDGAVNVIQTVITQEGARTAALDPYTGFLYLPVSSFVKNADGSRRDNAEGWSERVPGTFKVLVVGRR